MPMLEVILPYLNAIVTVITNILKVIATLVGYEQPEITDSGGVGGLKDNADDATDAIGGTTKAVKELKNSLAGFDELTVIGNKADTESGSGGSESSGVASDIELGSYDDMMKGIKQKSDEIAKSIEEMLARVTKAIKPFTDALKKFMEWWIEIIR